MGQRSRLSKRDLLKVNRLYDCKEFLRNDKALEEEDSSANGITEQSVPLK